MRTYLTQALSLSIPNDFPTIRDAIDYSYTLDTMGYPVNINLSDGTYYGDFIIDKPLVGNGELRIIGNLINLSDVYLIGGVNVYNGGKCVISNLKIRSDYICLNAYDRGEIDFSNLTFTTTLYHHIQASYFGLVRAIGDYGISGGGGAQSHAHAFSRGLVDLTYKKLTFLGGCTFSKWFVGVSGATCNCEGMTFAGPGFQGKRFHVHGGGLIDTNTKNELFFPGTRGGTTDTGGQFE